MSDRTKEYLGKPEIPEMTVFEQKILLNQMAILNALRYAPFVPAATAESLSCAFSSTNVLLKLATGQEG